MQQALVAIFVLVREAGFLNFEVEATTEKA